MRAETTRTLPREYREAEQFNLQSNKKEKILVNGAAVLLAVVMAVIGVLLIPVKVFFDTESPAPSLWRIATMFFGTVAYMLLHEVVRAIFMRAVGKGTKPRLSFAHLSLYAASDAYFNRRDYLLVLLSPVVFFGAVLLVLNVLVPTPWFWVIYFIQIVNISGAVGDVYVTVRLLRMPKSVLVCDDGISMRMYLPKKKTKK